MTDAAHNYNDICSCSKIGAAELNWAGWIDLQRVLGGAAAVVLELGTLRFDGNVLMIDDQKLIPTSFFGMYVDTNGIKGLKHITIFLRMQRHAAGIDLMKGSPSY